MLVNCDPVRHSPSPLKIAFVSGLSDPQTCALSPEQQSFLSRVSAPDDFKVWSNFPYVATTRQPAAQTPLLRASWNNASQFLTAGRPWYRDAARRHLQSLVASTDSLVLVTISCGLEIVARALPGLVFEGQLRVVAFGPVALVSPDAPVLSARGDKDYVSGLFVRGVDHVLQGVGHMDYMASHEALELVNRCISSSTSVSPEPGTTARRPS
ncbi:MAG: hypothetical protein AAGJ46_04320 [Planctomycetota bacterium]